MSDQLIMLVAGAIIGLISSLITQHIHLQTTRKWTLEDRQLERRFATLNERINASRKNLYDQQALAMKYFEIEVFLIGRGPPSDLHSRLTLLTKTAEETNKNYSHIASLQDEELRTANSELSKLLANEQSELERIYNSFTNNISLNQEEETKRITNFFTSTNILHLRILKRLDELSGFNQ